MASTSLIKPHGFPTVKHPRVMRVVRITLNRDFVKEAQMAQPFLNVVITPTMTASELLEITKNLLSLHLPASPNPQTATFLAECRLWEVTLGDAVPYSLISPDACAWALTAGEKRPKVELRKLAQKAPLPPSRSLDAPHRTGSHIGSSSSGFRPVRSAKSLSRTLSVNLGYRRPHKSGSSSGLAVLPAESPEGGAFPGIRLSSALPSAAPSEGMSGLVYRRRGKKLGKAAWKPAYMSLQDGCLYIFKREAAAQEGKGGCDRVVSLERHLVTPLTKAEANGREFSFTLRALPRQGGAAVSKPIYLSVLNPYDLQQWMKCFNLHIEKATQLADLKSSS